MAPIVGESRPGHLRLPASWCTTSTSWGACSDRVGGLLPRRIGRLRQGEVGRGADLLGAGLGLLRELGDERGVLLPTRGLLRRRPILRSDPPFNGLRVAVAAAHRPNAQFRDLLPLRGSRPQGRCPPDAPRHLPPTSSPSASIGAALVCESSSSGRARTGREGRLGTVPYDDRRPTLTTRCRGRCCQADTHLAQSRYAAAGRRRSVRRTTLGRGRRTWVRTLTRGEVAVRRRVDRRSTVEDASCRPGH
jgi:hypothetical protein